MDNLTQIVRAAQAGDGAAFEELVLRFQDMAVGYAARIQNDFQRAEDAAQDAFLEAFRVLPQLKEPAAFPAWFRRIVYKQCDRYRRRKSFQESVSEETEDTPSDRPNPDEAMAFRERRRAVRKAIGELPDLEREAILLFYFGGQAQREIAEFLEVPLTTLKKRLFSGRVRHLAGPKRWQPGWRKERSPDDTFANVYDAEHRLVEIEQYESTGEYCGKTPLVNTRIETPEGELIMRHETRRVSADAYDIYVTDPSGRLHVILHHSEVNRDGPNTIREEWMER